MARSVIFVNDSGTLWTLSRFGGLVVPATDILDVTAVVTDDELASEIQKGLGTEFDAEHYLRVGGVDLSAAESLAFIGEHGDSHTDGSDQIAPATSYIAGLLSADDKHALDNVTETGLVDGGEVTINGGDNTKFDISAGNGIVTNNYTDPTHPTVTHIAFGPFTLQTPTYLLTNQWSYVGIDSAGAIVQQATDFTAAQRRDIIALARLVHTNKTNLAVIVPTPYPGFDRVSDLRDIIRVLTPINISGNDLSPNGANLKVDRSAGEQYRVGSNFHTSKKVPSISAQALAIASQMGYEYQSATPGEWVTAFGTTDIDPDNWDDGSGTLQSVTAGKWTIQNCFVFSSARIWIQYGQVEYASKAEALSHIRDAFVISPHLSDACYRAWLVVGQGATDLSNTAQAEFVSAGRLGLVDIVSGGSAAGEVNTASNEGLSGVGPYLTKTGVNLEFKNVNPASSKITVVNNAGNKTVDLDVAEANLTLSNQGGVITEAQHGDQPINDGLQHAVSTASLSGFMSATDKAKLDGMVAGAHPALDFSLGDNNGPGSVAGSATPTILRYLTYDGTDVWTPAKFTIIAQTSNGTRPVTVDFYDVTNGLLLAQVTGILGTVPTIYSSTSFTNLPTGLVVVALRAYWETQACVCTVFSAIASRIAD